MIIVLDKPIGEKNTIQLKEHERIAFQNDCVYVVTGEGDTQNTTAIIPLHNILAIAAGG